MSAVPEEERFSKNVNIMIEAIQDSVNRAYQQGITTINPILMGVIASVIASFDKHHLIQGFIENSHEQCWDQIKERNEEFFINNVGSIFRYLPAEKVNLFKDLYLAKDTQGNSVVTPAMKEQIWKLFDAMIKIAIKYIHRNRSPYSTSTSEGIINDYGADFFGEVNIPHHCRVWGVVLDFPAKC